MILLALKGFTTKSEHKGRSMRANLEGARLPHRFLHS
jgi:hypothetical protein